jgi:thymidine kinase
MYYTFLIPTMAKLYFRYGTVNCGKTRILLAVVHSYITQGKKVKTMIPAIADREGKGIISSRNGEFIKADYIIEKDTDISTLDFTNVNVILTEECQFFTKEQIQQLDKITAFKDIPVMCYGLKSTYTNEFFEGSEELMLLADSIEEIKTICNFCHKKATKSMKVDENNNCTLEGDGKIEIGYNYIPTCKLHYYQKIEDFRILAKQPLEEYGNLNLISNQIDTSKELNKENTIDDSKIMGFYFNHIPYYEKDLLLLMNTYHCSKDIADYYLSISYCIAEANNLFKKDYNEPIYYRYGQEVDKLSLPTLRSSVDKASRNMCIDALKSNYTLNDALSYLIQETSKY